MATQIHSGKERVLSVEGVDNDQNRFAVSIDSLTVDDTSVVEVIDNGDGTFTLREPEGAGVGDTIAHLGVRGQTIDELVDIIEGDAVSFSVVAGEERDRTPAAEEPSPVEEPVP